VTMERATSDHHEMGCLRDIDKTANVSRHDTDWLQAGNNEKCRDEPFGLVQIYESTI
jgi:hypothetical protein